MIKSWKEAVGLMLEEEDLKKREIETLEDIRDRGLLSVDHKLVIKKYFNKKGIKLGCSTEAEEEFEYPDSWDRPVEIPMPLRVPEREPVEVPIKRGFGR